MRRQVKPLLALTFLLSVTLGAQEATRAPLPEWMADFLPKTAEEKARAAAFDSYGSQPVRLGVFSGSTACGVFLPGTPASPYPRFVAELACAHDAIAVASPNPVAARLNNRGTFIFTEHSMPVDRWLHPFSSWAAQVDVLVAGGTLKVGEQLTGMSVGEDLTADRYLFFLKRVPNSSAFVIAGTPLHERMGWNQRLPLHPIPVELGSNEVPFDRFIDDLANAAMSCPRQREPEP